MAMGVGDTCGICVWYDDAIRYPCTKPNGVLRNVPHIAPNRQGFSCGTVRPEIKKMREEERKKERERIDRLFRQVPTDESYSEVKN